MLEEQRCGRCPLISDRDEATGERRMAVHRQQGIRRTALISGSHHIDVGFGRQCGGEAGEVVGAEKRHVDRTEHDELGVADTTQSGGDSGHGTSSWFLFGNENDAHRGYGPGRSDDNHGVCSGAEHRRQHPIDHGVPADLDQCLVASTQSPTPTSAQDEARQVVPHGRADRTVRLAEMDGDEYGPVDEQVTDRVLTVPNLLSFGRLLCVPVFLWLLFGLETREGAAFLLAFLGITDWVDGYIARRFNQVSALGKVLDPAADRLLLGVGVVAIMIDGSVPLVVGWLTIARELAVAVTALVLASLGARRVDVSWAGKCGTFAMMIAFPLFLLGNGHGVAAAIAWPVAVFGLAVGWYAAAAYVPQGVKALREGRDDRRRAPAGA